MHGDQLLRVAAVLHPVQPQLVGHVESISYFSFTPLHLDQLSSGRQLVTWPVEPCNMSVAFQKTGFIMIWPKLGLT